MAGKIISAENFAAIIDEFAVPTMVDAYEQVTSPYQTLTRLIPWEDSLIFGSAWQTVGGGDDLQRRKPGESVRVVKVGDGWQMLVATKTDSARLVITKEDQQAGEGRIREVVQGVFRTLGEAAALSKAQLWSDMLGGGTAASAVLFDQSYPNHPDPFPTFIYNGNEFFTATQTLRNSAVTPSNLITGGGGTLNATNLQAAKVLIESTSAVDDMGRKVMNKMTHLIVPPALEQTARVLMNSELLPGSTNNDTNTLRGSFIVEVDEFATDATAWYLARSQRGIVRIDSGIATIDAPVWDHINRSWSTTVETHYGFAVENWRGYLRANP